MLHVVIIFVAGFLASLFGTLIGGSSLVTIPTLLLLGEYTNLEFWLAKLWLIVGFYAIAVFVFFKLELVE